MPKPTLGSIVGGKYRLVRPLGEGGMGAVYEAEHVLTQKRAALKWVHPRGGCSEAAHARLLREAQATSRIRHRHVVEVYDVLREDDAVCLVMELLEGEPLSERMGRAPMALHELIGVLLPAMAGVAAAHAAGVVHRDIKPENIFLARESDQALVPKIIDFGISKLSDPNAPQLTHSGVTMGTPRYVSYEQLLGARDVDARADVYSFGVLLYEAITGVPPYRARSFGEQAVAFAITVPTPPKQLRPELPSALDELVQHAMAKERRLRLGSMQEFMGALAPFAEASAYPLAVPTRCARSDARSPDLPDPGKTTAPAVPTSEPSSASVAPVRSPPRSRAAALALSLVIAAASLVGWMLGERRSDGPLPPARADAREISSRPAEIPVPRAIPQNAPTAAGRQASPAKEHPSTRTSPPKPAGRGALALPTHGDGASAVPEASHAGRETRGLSVQRPAPAVERSKDSRAVPRLRALPAMAPATAASQVTLSARPRSPMQPVPALAFSVASEPSTPEPKASEPPARPTYRAGPLSRDEF